MSWEGPANKAGLDELFASRWGLPAALGMIVVGILVVAASQVAPGLWYNVTHK